MRDTDPTLSRYGTDPVQGRSLTFEAKPVRYTKAMTDESRPPKDLRITEVEMDLLDARLSDMELHPDEQSSWADVKSRLDRLLLEF